MARRALASSFGQHLDPLIARESYSPAFRHIRQTHQPRNFFLMNVANARFNEAYRLHSAGRREQAIPLYLEALRLAPDHLDALFMLGTLHAEMGDLAQAERFLAQAAELNPGSAQVQNNLGNVHLLAERYEQAQIHLLAALKLEPRLAEAAFNLSSIALRGEHRDLAVGYLRQALAARLQFVQAHLRLAELLDESGGAGEAASHFQQAARLEPGNARLQMQAGNIMARLGRDRQASEFFSQALKIDRGNASARFALDALRGVTPRGAPAEHVASIFDGMASSFEDHVGRLGYRIPALLRETLQRLPGLPARFARAVDLGCGTGLSGEAFRDIVDHMTGVDLSAGMLEKASARGVYAELVQGDVIRFLEGQRADVDLFIAADTFIYVGALEELFAAARACAAARAVFVFSTEKSASGPCRLQKTGRFAHSPEYIGELAQANRFVIRDCGDVGLRLEQEKWLPGQTFVLETV